MCSILKVETVITFSDPVSQVTNRNRDYNNTINNILETHNCIYQAAQSSVYTGKAFNANTLSCFIKTCFKVELSLDFDLQSVEES